MSRPVHVHVKAIVDDAAALEHGVREDLARLVMDLGLDLAPHLEVEARPSGAPLQLAIDGTPVAVPLVPTPEPRARLAAALVEHRSALAGERGAASSHLARGVSLARTDDQTLDAIALQLKVSTERLDDALRWSEALPERLWLRFGLLVAVDPPGTLTGSPADQLRLRVNDLVFPPRRLAGEPGRASDEEVVAQLVRWVTPHATCLHHLIHTRWWRAQLEDAVPVLGDRLRARFPDDRLLDEALVALLEEGHSLRDGVAIAESLCRAGGWTDADYESLIVFEAREGTLTPPQDPAAAARSAVDLAQLVRVASRDAISQRLSQAGTMTCFLVDPDFERDVAEGAVSTETMLRFYAELEEGVDANGRTPQVILTSLGARRRLFEHLRPARELVSVVAYQELAPWLSIQPLGRLG